MSVRETADPAEFLREAAPLLLPNEARDNLVFGIAAAVREAPDRWPGARFWIATEGDDPVGAALRTPPYNVVLATPRDPAALAALAEAIDDDLPGAVGARPDVDEFARLWAGKRAIRPRVLRAHGVYALEKVRPVPRPPGALREATQRDRQLALDWFVAFSEEVLEEDDPGRLEPAKFLDQRLGAEHGGIVLWEDGGRPVALAGWGGPTPNGIRVGPVYTPPELRGRGYATALTAELSQRLLDGGRRFCFLFTDLANPTSNAIYERIGYVRVGESAMLRFEPG